MIVRLTYTSLIGETKGVIVTIPKNVLNDLGWEVGDRLYVVALSKE